MGCFARLRAPTPLPGRGPTAPLGSLRPPFRGFGAWRVEPAPGEVRCGWWIGVLGDGMKHGLLSAFAALAGEVGAVGGDRRLSRF